MTERPSLGSIIVGTQGAEPFNYYRAGRAGIEVHPHGSLMWAMDHSRAVRALVAVSAILAGAVLGLISWVI